MIKELAIHTVITQRALKLHNHYLYAVNYLKVLP